MDFVIKEGSERPELADPKLENDPEPQPVPSHVVHEVYQVLEGSSGKKVVKIGEAKKAITSYPKESPAFPGKNNRLIPIQEPTMEDFERLRKFSNNLPGNFDPTRYAASTNESESTQRQERRDKSKPLYSHVEGDLLYEYFEE